MDSILFWATVLSPIVGVIAIIVALIVARSSTNEIKRQVDATYNLLDVFVAAQNPTMLEAKKQYEQQLAQLDQQIGAVKDDIETIRHPFGFVNRLEAAEAAEDQLKRIQYLEELGKQRKGIEEKLSLIQSYLDKAKKSK